VTVSYDDAFSLMRDLRHMGEGNVLAGRQKHFTRRDVMMKTAALCQPAETPGAGIGPDQPGQCGRKHGQKQ